jgi:outer membrane protein OmpA-like peptidoglycan-associated protein
MRSLAMVAVLLVPWALAGCAAAPPKQSDCAPLLTGHTSFPPDVGRYPGRAESQLTMTYVPVEVDRVCAGADPRFAFDSARLARVDARTVRGLSLCMKDGPLARRDIVLVGRADSRGTDEYNERLGLRRAEAVKLALMKTGIPSERIAVASLGKQDAVVPARAWDRRVDVALAQ